MRNTVYRRSPPQKKDLGIRTKQRDSEKKKDVMTQDQFSDATPPPLITQETAVTHQRATSNTSSSDYPPNTHTHGQNNNNNKK